MATCPRCRVEYVLGFAHRCADGFLMLPGMSYDSDNPTPTQRKCLVCGKDYKGISQYCSLECFESDREARLRRSQHLCEVCHKPFNGIGFTCSSECYSKRKVSLASNSEVIWFRNSDNPNINSFEAKLTDQDKQFLSAMKIGWLD